MLHCIPVHPQMQQQTGALRAKHANFNELAINETKDLTGNKMELEESCANEEVDRGTPRVI